MYPENHNNIVETSCSLGDYIGTESCLDMKNNNSEEMSIYSKVRCKRMAKINKKKREFPPPITLLARIEDQPLHMPWILKRHYTSDGRLILYEERVRHHEYFKAQRSDGHLILQLVQLDDINEDDDRQDKEIGDEKQ